MNAIVAVDQNWAIGLENTLLFALPSDMKHFRSLTLGGSVILGRKTLDSFPGGKPLDKRQNLVVTHDPSFQREGCICFPNPQAALDSVQDADPDTVWLIGGSSIYTALLAKCKRVYLTKVETMAPEADAFFPNLDKLPYWQMEHASEPMTEEGLTFRFIEYVNTKI